MAAAGIINTVKATKPLTDDALQPLAVTGAPGNEQADTAAPTPSPNNEQADTAAPTPTGAGEQATGTDYSNTPSPTVKSLAPSGAGEQATGTDFTDTPGGDPHGDPAGVAKPTTPAIPVATQPTPAPTDVGGGVTDPPPPTPSEAGPSSPSGDGTPGSPPPAQPAAPVATGSAPAMPRVDTAGTAPGGAGQAWTPTSGIVDQVRQADVNTVTGTSYTPTTTPAAEQANATGYDSTGVNASLAPDAVGYTAGGYTPNTVDENLSGAVNRIMGDDSPVLQRARALADQQSNARGILNSTMGAQAGTAATLDKATELGQGDVNVSQFNANAKNAAAAFLADATNTSAAFLAAAKNQNGQFNAAQSQQASEFTAAAKDTASQLLAAAKNSASMFNAGEANKQAQFAVTQTNQALMFAAQMEQAAREQNATAFNQAHQRYTDAVNAALAAQNDAENLAKRDTAQLTEQRYESDSRNAASTTAASIGASASLQAASMASADRASALAEQAHEFGVTMGQHETDFAANLTASQFNQYQQGLSAGLASQMEPDAKQNWLHNYNAVWAASGSLPFNIDMTQFPAAGTTTANP